MSKAAEKLHLDGVAEPRKDAEETRLERLCDRLEKYTLDVTMAISAAMLVVAWLHVTRRYVFNSALSWSEEFLRFSIVWYALLSASILHKRNGHLGITIIRETFPKGVQRFLRRAVIYLGTLTAAVVTVFGAVLVAKTWAQHTPALGIPVGLPYAAIPVSFLLMTLYGVVHVVRDLQGLPPIGSKGEE